MNFSNITEDFAVTGQLAFNDSWTVSGQGFGTVINCRPDGEKPGMMMAVQAGEGAAEHGMEYHHIPVAMNGISEAMVEEFAQALDAAKGPVLAYCASGRRAVILWAIVHAGKIAVAQIVSSCAQAGHDISQLVPLLQHRAQQAA